MEHSNSVSHADVPPSPVHSDDSIKDAPVAMTTRRGSVTTNGKEIDTTRFRFVPTKQCSILAMAMLIMTSVLGFAFAVVIAGVGDPSWAYGTIGAILAVAIVKFKDAKIQEALKKKNLVLSAVGV